MAYSKILYSLRKNLRQAKTAEARSALVEMALLALLTTLESEEEDDPHDH